MGVEALRVLLVEDTKIAQKMVSHGLKSFNVELEVAETGGEAFDLLEKNQYDLILMDIALPDVDGLTISQTVRSMEEGLNFNTPIVALTAHAIGEFREQADEVGMNGFYIKPVASSGFREMFMRLGLLPMLQTVV